MSKSVQIGALDVRPLPTETADMVPCTHCRTNAAKWELARPATPAWNFCCSICFLYELPVTRVQRDAVNWLATQVEVVLGKQFPRDAEGCLIREEDADRLTAGILMTQRYERQRGMQP